MSEPNRSFRVLIVDDEKSISDSLGLVFTARGYEVRVAYNAEQALEMSMVWKPRLAILDVVLPKMSGIDLAILFKEILPECHVILFSGQLVTEDLAVEASRKGHEFDIVPKPVGPIYFLDAAQKLKSVSCEAETQATHELRHLR